MSTITLTGPFSKQDIHSWLGGCLPDMPPVSDEVESTHLYRSTFSGLFVACTVSRGKAVLRSENISALTILKDAITAEASLRKVQIDI